MQVVFALCQVSSWAGSPLTTGTTCGHLEMHLLYMPIPSLYILQGELISSDDKAPWGRRIKVNNMH